MANVHDVASYILNKKGPMTAMKLQKLVYYAQAWSLVWDERPLFDSRIEAWANGPVVRDLYSGHKGIFELKDWPDGHIERLDDKAKETIDAVLEFYGDRPAQWLSDLTHQEAPWRQAREGIAPNGPSEREITPASMHEYYSGL